MKTIATIVGLGINKGLSSGQRISNRYYFPFRIKLNKRKTKRKKIELIQLLIYFPNIKRELQTT